MQRNWQKFQYTSWSNSNKTKQKYVRTNYKYKKIGNSGLAKSGNLYCQQVNQITAFKSSATKCLTSYTNLITKVNVEQYTAVNNILEHLKPNLTAS